MTIQSVITSVCEGASQVATNVASHAGEAANWLGRAVAVVGQHAWNGLCNVSDMLSKLIASICTLVSPILESIANFAIEHQQTLIPASAGVAIGIAGTLALGALLSKSQQQPVI